MILSMNPEVAEGYKSPSQIARVITEAWGKSELYCPACPSVRLKHLRNNSPASDYRCTDCGARYQLKSSSRWNSKRIVDAGYRVMMKAIRDGNTPNLVLLHYDRNWSVVNLLLIPDFFFVPSIIEKRRPLGPTARRAGWIGCNILLSAVPPEGKIRIVDKGSITPSKVIRQRFEAVKPFARLNSETRGWTLEVLNVVRSLRASEFRLSQIYNQEAYFQRIHPRNKFVRAKIRQQLQVLRDIGYIEFLGRGRYRFLR